MTDNTTAFFAADYDSRIRASIPYYDAIQREIIDLVRLTRPDARDWLDTGCGTGTFALLVRNEFPDAALTITDPSAPMLDLARKKTGAFPAGAVTLLNPCPTQEIELPAESFDVVTALLCHHYLDPMTRRRATLNCARMLRPGGIYIAVENIRPETPGGIQIALERWKRFQIHAGKSVEEAAEHVARCGTAFFPLTAREHRNLLQDCGFNTRETFWTAQMQGGFYGMKTVRPLAPAPANAQKTPDRQGMFWIDPENQGDKTTTRPETSRENQ